MSTKLTNSDAQRIMHDIMSLDKPSQNILFYWIKAYSPSFASGDKRIGKWLIWVNRQDIDRVWIIIKEATENGTLGIASKVSTAKPNVHSSNLKRHVICIYTYDYKNKENINKVRQSLRKMGFLAKIPYKTDSATLAGRYGFNSSLYYE